MNEGAAQRRLVQAQVGHSVYLPCLVPLPNITQWDTLRLYVQKSGPGALPTTVFTFSKGQEQPDHQDRSYHNRSSLFKGNITLSLTHISPWDEGEYDCHVFLLKKLSHELEYSGHLLLSVWAEYSQPQITVFSSNMTEQHVICSSQGGYPKGYFEWKSSPNVTDTKKETLAEHHPQTQLYNISGRLTLNSGSWVSVSCCVVTRERTVCSESLIIPTPGKSRAGRPRGAEGPTTVLCLILLLSLTR
ncbi:T-lymphocyte activation antigen CD80-like isoform X2 [Mixophyes fleayi]|uniref:T-lymphocyte activation antigen CD80-like isoform X2 n=1 Tax=Mixophyes fleayi TaxID=3061075 RepID=UPI003F4DB28F